METLDYRLAGAVEPPQPIVALFASRNRQGYVSEPGFDEEWKLVARVRKVDADAEEAAVIAGEERPSGTVLGPDNVSLESISLALARGPVVIQATDEQAHRIMRRHKEDAFPPQ
jgi:hypothetical protein